MNSVHDGASYGELKRIRETLDGIHLVVTIGATGIWFIAVIEAIRFFG